MAPAQSGGALSLIAMMREQIRLDLRARLRAIDAVTRRKFSLAICRHTLRWLGTRAATQTIAAYLAVRQEPDLAALMGALRARGADAYLPRIASYRRRSMAFAVADGFLVTNRYGIREPHRDAPARRALDLDVVLLPLLAFDERGTRLGTGGGYYDRAFAFRAHRLVWRRPLLVGIAFACQRVDRIPVEHHDIPLDAVVTELGVTRFGKERT